MVDRYERTCPWRYVLKLQIAPLTRPSIVEENERITRRVAGRDALHVPTTFAIIVCNHYGRSASWFSRGHGAEVPLGFAAPVTHWVLRIAVVVFSRTGFSNPPGGARGLLSRTRHHRSLFAFSRVGLPLLLSILVAGVSVTRRRILITRRCVFVEHQLECQCLHDSRLLFRYPPNTGTCIPRPVRTASVPPTALGRVLPSLLLRSADMVQTWPILGVTTATGRFAFLLYVYGINMSSPGTCTPQVPPGLIG